MSRVWDEEAGHERATLYLPAFPVAEWVVHNWWSLLYEACPLEEPPRATARGERLPWVKRHCLRSAESGLVLPAMYLYDDGRSVRAVWYRDEPDQVPHMPAVFVDSGCASIDRDSAIDSLSRFIAEVLHRARNCDDRRVGELRADWQAIVNADADEQRFCIVAGRMGLDPYDCDQVPEGVARLIEDELDDPDRPLIRDLSEVATADSLADAWRWMCDVRRRYGLAQGGVSGIDRAASSHAASQAGYELARTVRARAHLSDGAPVEAVDAVAGSAAGVHLEVLTGVEPALGSGEKPPPNAVRAVVGWSGRDRVVVAARGSAQPASARFLAARGLCHGLFACDRGERLVSDAHTWDQQVSRAFAAELLAPQAALTGRTGLTADESVVAELAAEYLVSPWLVGHQLQNAGVQLLDA